MKNSPGNMTIPFFIPNLGCQHMCIFCDQRASTGVRAIPGRKEVEDKITEYISSPSARRKRIEAGFFGGSFTAVDSALQDELLSAASGFLRKGLISGIRVSTRPDAAGPRQLALLKKHGVTTVEIGAQSFDNRVLGLSERGHTVDDIISAAELIKAQGFGLVIQIMTGLPGETPGMAVQSARSAARLSPSAVRIYPVIVIAGTRLAELYRSGAYRALTLDEAVEIVKEQLKVFRSAGIPVIRTGVHPFSEADKASVTAGPFHPAFGFLAKSALMLDELRAETRNYRKGRPGSTEIRITLPLKSKEEYIGHRRSNIEKLKSGFGLSRIETAFHEADNIVIEAIE